MDTGFTHNFHPSNLRNTDICGLHNYLKDYSHLYKHSFHNNYQHTQGNMYKSCLGMCLCANNQNYICAIHILYHTILHYICMNHLCTLLYHYNCFCIVFNCNFLLLSLQHTHNKIYCFWNLICIFLYHIYSQMCHTISL